MSNTDSSTRPAPVRRLRRCYYRNADALQSAIHKYSTFTPREYEVTTDRERKKIAREIERLAEELGIDHDDMTYEQTYIASIKALGGSERGNARAVRLGREADEIRRRVAALRTAKAEAEKQGRAAADAAIPKTRHGLVNVANVTPDNHS